MNIAICICGEPRNKEIGAKSIKKFREEIKKYNVNFLYNKNYKKTDTLESFSIAKHVIDDELLATFDKQLFCLDNFRERIGLKNLEKWKEEQTLKEGIQAKKMDDWIFEDYEES